MAISASTGAWVIGTSWPWPQVIVTDRFFLGFAIKGTKLALYELTQASNTWTATEKVELGNLTAITSVSVSGFDVFYMLVVEGLVAGVKTRATFARNVSTGVVAEVVNTLIPAGSCCCNFNGQYIVGGLISTGLPWSGLGTCSIAWSDVGSTEMNPGVSVNAGYAKMSWDNAGSGDIHAVIPLSNSVVVYGNYGICVLTPTLIGSVSAFEKKDIPGGGILSKTAVAGDSLQHLFINKNHSLFLMTSQGIKELGYKKQMKTLTGVIRISLDSQEGKFYISDGASCYVWNGQGLYSTHQCVTSVGRYNNHLCGFTKLLSDNKIRLKISGFNYGDRRRKSIEGVETGITYSSGISMVLGALYDYTGSYTTLPAVILNPLGKATNKISGKDFSLELYGTYSSGAEFALGDVMTKIKYLDDRSAREGSDVS